METFGYVIDITAMVLLYLGFFMPKWRARGRESLIAGTLMYVYLCGVIYFTLMPVFLSLPRVITGPRGTINMHPFRDLLMGYGDSWRQIALNILMTVPLGILYPISRGRMRFGTTVTLGFLFSLWVEFMQPMLHVHRCFDVTDIITNTLGTALGFAALLALKPVFALVFPETLGTKRRRN